MNADTASPTTPPTPAPMGGPQPPVPAPGATTPPDQHQHGHAEPNALLEFSKKAWNNIKEGKVGNPKVLLLVLAVVAILAAWWFLARSSKQNDSALWTGFDYALTGDSLKKFTDDQAVANTVAGKIASLNELRLKKDSALRNLTAAKLADRVAAADSLEKLRDEFAGMAEQFATDRTMKAQSYLAAAECEMAVIGVPKKGIATMGADVKGNCRGQVDKYAELMKKAADAIGAGTEAGKDLLAKAEKYSKDLDASELYRRLGTFHVNFNNPDPVPGGGLTDPNGPKAPDSIPGLTPPKPDDQGTPVEAPKPPDGLPPEKK